MEQSEQSGKSTDEKAVELVRTMQADTNQVKDGHSALSLEQLLENDIESISFHTLRLIAQLSDGRCGDEIYDHSILRNLAISRLKKIGAGIIGSGMR